MAVALFFLGRHNPSQVGIAAEHWHGLSGLGLALVPVMFAYDGWNGFTAMSGEVRNPGRTIPVSLAAGVITVAIVYVLVNLAYFSVLPFGFIQRSNQVAADAVFVIAGRAGISVISLLVMLATFSSLNATVMTDPRICFAMAETGLFFRSVGRVHPRWGTPYVAILLRSTHHWRVHTCLVAVSISSQRPSSWECGRSLHLPLPQFRCFDGPVRNRRDRIGQRLTQ